MIQKIIGGFMLEKIIQAFITKKRVIGWIASLAFAGGAVATGLQSAEFKAAVCDAPIMEQK